MHPISKRKKSETKKGCHSIIHSDMAVKTLTWNLELIAKLLQLFHNGGRYHLTSFHFSLMFFYLAISCRSTILTDVNITDRENKWTLIEEIHSIYYEEKCCGLFLVVV